MGWELKIARENTLLREGHPLMISVSESGNGEKRSAHRHYLPGMSPPFRKQMNFLVFVILLVMPFKKKRVKPLAAPPQDAFFLKAKAPIFEGVHVPIFATGYQTR
jgi:hypothetical protein